MWSLRALLLISMLSPVSGESRRPSRRIAADPTKRRKRTRLAAGAEKRRARAAASYIEETDSGSENDTDCDEYLTSKQLRNKKGNAKKKENAGKTSGGTTSRKRKPVSANKDTVSKKRGRPAKTAANNTVTVEEDSMTAPKKRGRKPKSTTPGNVDEMVINGPIASEKTESAITVADSLAIANDVEELEMEGLALITPRRTRRNKRSASQSAIEDDTDIIGNREEWKTAKQKGDHNREERFKIEEGTPRPSTVRVKKHRDNNGEDSDGDDSEDDIPEPENFPPCRLGDLEECPYCSAQHYANGHVCCDKGAVFIPPMRKLPAELFHLMFGKGVNSKLFRSRILGYNNAFAFASIQYHRVPAAAYGVQSMKIQGNPGHFPSCAIPYGNNDPLYGNVYLYCGQKAVDLRINAYSHLNKDVVRILEICMTRDNCWASYYRTLGDIISEEEKKSPGSSDQVRMKIINANEVDPDQLQAHKGVYRKVIQGGDHVALFFQSTVEQDVKMPGLIIYPKRGTNPILPLFVWDPKATSLCYPLFCPYGEFVFSHKMYPLMKGDDRNMNFMERLARYAREEMEEAKIWEVDVDAETLVGNIVQQNDAEPDDVEMDEMNEDREEELVDEQFGEVFYDAIAVPVDDGREREEVPVVVETAVNDPVEEMVQDMNFEENEQDYYNAITWEQYPMLENEQQDEEQNNNSSSPCFYPSGGAGDISPNQNPPDVAELQEEIEGEYDNDDEDDSKQNTKGGSRNFASLKQFITYSYQRRALVHNRFLRGEKLGQLFLIDHYMRMLNQRYTFIRDRCGEYLTSTKNKLLKARQRLADKLHLGITIGAQFSVPHTVPGSPRWLQQKFENAVAMCNAFGRPDLFVTATCNVKWPEIKDKIPAGETWADHPFLVNEVFKKKLDMLMELLNGKGVDKRTKKKKKGIFGRVCWFTYSIEFQQRGPPHAHILISLKKKPKNVLQVDKLSQAVLPTNNPVLRKLVEDFMIHTPCEGDPTAYCREGLNPSKLQCSKGFPKCFNDTTKMGDRYYPELERPCDGEHTQKNKKADNRYVVPYNTQLLSFWEGHINCEVISVLSVVKYIFKYLFKGFDRALVEIATGTDSLDKNAMTIDGHLLLPKNVKIPEGTLRKRRQEAKKLLRTRGIPLKDKNGQPTVVFNEFWVVEDMRAVTSCEAAWEYAGYPRHAASHTVIENSIHAEDEERLIYTADEQEKLCERLEDDDLKTRLKAWFILNETDPAAREYTFANLPMGYLYSKGQWRPRKRKIKNLVTRIKSVNPRYKELYAIRLLCSNLKGIKSFKELRTVNGVEYPTAIEAAYALGFMNNQKEWDLCLAEACSYDNPKALRRMFCQIITNNGVSKEYVRELYNKYKAFFYVGHRWDEKNLEAHSLYHIQSFLEANGASLEEYGLPPLIKEDLLPYDLVDDTGRLHYTERFSKREAANLKKAMIVEQKKVFEEILEDIRSGEKTAFFLQGSGGTGKTWIMKALFHEFRSQKKNVACVAQTGIAASLLPLGSTAHRQFKIPLSSEENMHSTMDLESYEAEYIKNLDLVIWDEVTMADRRILECVHKLMSTLRYGSDNRIFGGCPFILSGDWKQTLPVVPDVPGEGVVNYTAIEWLWWRKGDIKVMNLYKNMRARDDPVYAEYCAKIGTGELNVNTHVRSVDQKAPLPPGRLVGSVKELISKIYGGIGNPEAKRETFRKSTILAVDNETVFDLNNKMLNLLDTEERVFKSIDEYDPKHGLQYLDPETYHLATPSGYPRHELKVKVGAVVILSRNLNVNKGMSNGTRLVVEEIGAHTLRCTPLNPEKHMPEEIFLHPVLFTPTGVISREISFTRLQFPVRLAFAMTCNKAQGQTLERCGLVLTTPCFTHGQYYVAVSRVRKAEDIFIYNAAKNSSLTNNVVFKKVLAYEKTGDGGETGNIITEDKEVLNNSMEPENSIDLSENSDAEDITDFYSTNPAGPPVSTLAVGQEFSNRTNSSFFGLKNLGNTCYGNSVIQTLWRMWRLEINGFEGQDNVYFKKLNEILNMPEPKSAKPLLYIEDMPPMYRDLHIQQSAAELIMHVFERIPPNFYLQLLHISRRIVTCSVCGQRRQTGRDDEQCVLNVGGELEEYRTFNEYVHSILTPGEIDQNCESCQSTNVRHQEETEIIIPETCKYLAMEMGLFGSEEGTVYRRDRRIGTPNRREKLFGEWFKPIAAIWHRGETPMEGHYMAYVETSGRWIECNDSRLKERDLPRKMEGVVVVILERESGAGQEEEVVMEIGEENEGEGRSSDISAHNHPTVVVSNGRIVKELIIEMKSIVEVDTEVIVNAANAQLLHGGGVDGIIRAACGPTEINKATGEISKRLPNGQLSSGQVVSTSAFKMKKYKRIYHTAAPIITRGRQPTRSQEEHLRLCYYNSLLLADKDGFKSIAFPLLGIGIYNYDEKKGMAIALQAVFVFFESYPNTRIEQVHLVAISSLVIGRLQTLAGGQNRLQLDSVSAQKARSRLEEKLIGDKEADAHLSLPGCILTIPSFL